ncbi:TlpA family protein disulfide reductase [Neptunitalea lumnitzerae]|uniref:Thioredoxin domain-containing protein n=1 Tax=Neptunitalea lumnitzerae TaxID=2965509 RepID=A0ABQ5MI56_9FLAO|nr:hypothetical protein [Neptunitalea sp. Y10]GLB48612.1 hypothetical protein Y10_09800 [Neptunitalea sp. Y10]
MTKRHYTILLLYIYIITIFSCSNKKKHNDISKDEISLTIHYSDKNAVKFIKPSKHEKIEFAGHKRLKEFKHKLKYSKRGNDNYSLNLKMETDSNQPVLISIGFKQAIVFPGYQIDLNYKVIENSKTIHKDTLSTSKHMYLLYNGDGKHQAFNEKAFHKITNNTINYKYVLSQTDETLSKIDLKSYESKEAAYLKQYLTYYYQRKYIYLLMLKASKVYQTLQEDQQQWVQTSIKNIMLNFSKTSMNYRDYHYWSLLEYYYNQYLNEYDYKSFENYIKDFDADTKDHFRVSYLLSLDGKNNTLRQIVASTIKQPIFNDKAIEILKKNNNAVLFEKEIKLISYNNEIITLENLFHQTKQRLLYLDFCGTWCAPCLEEIKKYAEINEQTNSKEIRPLWIFFENETDSLSWKSTIKKYNLPENNCFRLHKKTAKNLTETFQTAYRWTRNFPHHFIFTNTGAEINLDAPPLYQINL